MLYVELIAGYVDLLAVLVLIVGLVVSVIFASQNVRKSDTSIMVTITGDVLREFRISLGRWLLVALEILIVSDILHSIAHRTLEEVVFLAGIVIIRTTLSFFLDQEIQRMERIQTGAKATLAKKGDPA